MSLVNYCFFFSSRRRHTRCGRDWSSDVCSSDLLVDSLDATVASRTRTLRERLAALGQERRSEERRVGKSVDLGGRRIIKKKKKRYTASRDRTDGQTEEQ